LKITVTSSGESGENVFFEKREKRGKLFSGIQETKNQDSKKMIKRTEKKPLFFVDNYPPVVFLQNKKKIKSWP